MGLVLSLLHKKNVGLCRRRSYASAFQPTLENAQVKHHAAGRAQHHAAEHHATRSVLKVIICVPSTSRSELVEGEGDAWPRETGCYLPIARKVDTEGAKGAKGFHGREERGCGDFRELLAWQMEGLKEELQRL